MRIWLDEHLSPLMAQWITREFGLAASHVRELNLERAEDRDIFSAARSDVVLITKDADFIALLERLGPPPRIIWLTCGNSTNANLKQLFERRLQQSILALEGGEPVVEIG
jgi:predicted nuclease of predicted toxin-antitoxin system